MIDPFSSNWFGYCLALFLLTFAHEDVAILATAFARLEHGLPLEWAALCVYTGIVTSDLFIYALGRLQAGEDFRIIEINGAGSEAIHAWDPQLPLHSVSHELFQAQSLMFEIAARNRARGFSPSGLPSFLRSALHQYRLLIRYPPSG